MLFNSIEFLLFFPAVTILYFVIPKKLRVLWILLTSYVFYMGWNASYALLLLFSTVVTFFSGKLIAWSKRRCERAEEMEREAHDFSRLFVALCFVLNLSILFFFKYFDFAVDNLNAVLHLFGGKPIRPSFDVLLPVGISFYIFQALSYTVDVYRGDVEVERSFIKYAAFVSFFPQLVAGPIERSSHLLSQFNEPKNFDAERVRDGLLLMLWGFMEKIVIADRVAVLVSQVFDYSSYYSGFEVLVAMLLFAVQIYGDFAGYSDIAIGAAQVMGFDLMENFRRPYFARSVSEFWRRWHISLSQWFRDYLYIPLGGNRRGKTRKYVNLMIVFLCSGLWHGAAWNYVIWGGLNGAYQVIGEITKPYRKQAMEKLGMRTETFSHRLLQMLITFVLIDIAWVFFRANTAAQAISMLGSLFRFNPWVLTDGSLFKMGMTETDFLVLIPALCVLLLVSVLRERGIHLRKMLSKQELWFRWLCILTAIFTIVLFGVYGPGFDTATFIYFQF